MTRTRQELSEAIAALKRIRGTEAPPDPEGLRSVWHQARGAELLSWVDQEGKARRQELFLFEDVITWSAADGLRTGSLDGRGRTAAALSAETYSLDPQLSVERLHRAAQGFGDYAGEDRYLRHMAELVARAIEGLQLSSEERVTGEYVAPARPPGLPTAPPDAPARRSRAPVVIAVLVVAAAAIAVALLMR